MRKILSILIFTLTSLFSLSTWAADFTLTSSAATQEGVLPTQYTCDGKDISPPISWSGAPATAKSYALIVSDPDAPDGVFYHWIIWNLPKGTKTLAEGAEQLPGDAELGTNSFGKAGYNGPCPPKGTNHHYIFTLYALDKNLQLPTAMDAKTVLAAMNKHIVDSTKFIATYTRW
jgi:Raf kinase inhibitor-like YbhB/YbcL family protein